MKRMSRGTNCFEAWRGIPWKLALVFTVFLGVAVAAPSVPPPRTDQTDAFDKTAPVPLNIPIPDSEKDLSASGKTDNGVLPGGSGETVAAASGEQGKGSSTSANIDLDKVRSLVKTLSVADNAGGKNTEKKIVRSRSLFPDMLQAFSALAIVLALILFIFWGTRKLARKNALLGGHGVGEVIGRIYLSPRASVHFVRTGGRVLAIGVTPSQISLVAEFDSSDFPIRESGEALGLLKRKATHFFQELREAGGVSEDDELVGAPDDLSTLKQDIARLQERIDDTTRHKSDS